MHIFVGMEGDGSQIYGDWVQMVVKYTGMEWGWKKFHRDGAGTGLIFTTESFFSLDYR